MNSDNSLIFQILDWDNFHDENDDGKKIFTIRLFGRTKQSQTIYLQVDGFKPFFYVEMQPHWRESHIIKILEEVKKRVYAHKGTGCSKEELIGCLNSWKIITRQKFYGFTDYKKINFIQLTFDNYDAMKAYSTAFDKIYKIPILSKKAIKFRLYESNILPTLRFMHIRELDAVGWIHINKKDIKEFEDPPTCCTLNYKTSWTAINKIDDCVIESFTIASFDLECTSGDGSFPQPERESDAIIQIGITFSKYGESDCYEKICLCLKETAPVEGAEIIWFEKEEELMLGFTKLIRTKDPDIITGYNIFGFDFKYLMKRASKLGILSKFSALSRVSGEISEWVEQELYSAALGFNTLTYYRMTGRIIIDLMKVVQRDYKLSSYKLDYVASYFIKESIQDIQNISDTSRIKTKSTFGLVDDQYITIMYVEGAVDNVYEGGKKFKIKELGSDYLIVWGNIDSSVFMNKGYKVYWCQAKDDVSANDIFRLQKGTASDRAIIAKYCLQDCTLCNKLIAKLQVINNNVSMANVCHVPLSYLFLRGQGVKIFSLVSKKCRQKNHLIPVIKKKQKLDISKLDPSNPKHIKMIEKAREEEALENLIRDLDKKDKNQDDEDDDGYEGAIVFVPEPKVHYQPIPVLDFASLYPNAMRFRNLSHECFVNNSEYDNLPGYIYHDITYKGSSGKFSTCRFAEKLDGTKGIIPEILTDLLTARKKYKKLMESESDNFKKAILDSLQLAYKITANSLYGQTGASTSPIYMKEIAASTTCTGREALLFSKYFIEQIFSKLINLALTSESEFYSEIENKYMYFVHKFISEETNYLTGETDISTLHLHTLQNVKIPDSKFIRDSIGYETDKPNLKDIFEKLGYVDINDFEKKIIKPMIKLNPVRRNKLYHIIQKYMIINKGKAETIFGEYEEFMKNIGFTDYTMLKNKLLKPLQDISNEFKQSFVDWLKMAIEDLGYSGKKEFFEKIYLSMNMIMSGHTCQTQIIYGDTDSVFFKCSITDNTTKEVLKDKKSLGMAIQLGIWASIMICAMLPNPMAQEYEKVLWPFAIQGKKRYVGNLYEKNVNKFYQKSMGIETKRRDNAPIVKYVCNGIIDQIINRMSPDGACEFTKSILHNIITGKYGMDRFVITKTIKGPGMTAVERDVESAKPKENRFYAERTRIVHAVLADRIADRTPGNQPQSNDRIPYVYIETKGEPKLQGDRVETPEYIIANKLKIDYLFYITNQIMKPSMKFLELIVYDSNKIFESYIIREQNRKKSMVPIACYADSEISESNDFNQFDNLLKINNVSKPVRNKSVKKKDKILIISTNLFD